MKTYVASKEKKAFGVCNYERIDESVLFDKVVKLISSEPGVSILDRRTEPTEDIVNGSLDGVSFSVIFDSGYDLTEILCDNDQIREKLRRIVENG